MASLKTMIAILAVVIVSCGEDQSLDVEQLSGRFPLVAFEGQPLPVIQAPIPTRDGSESRCNILVSEGFLALDASSSRFEFEYATKHSCSQAIMSRFNEVGEFEQQGRLLRLPVHYPAAPDRDQTFTGTIEEEEITVFYYESELTFQR